MIILPAIDLHHGCAVRLLRGDYAQMTEYSSRPGETAAEFAAAGAEYIHVVDLEGAKAGKPANLEAVREIVRASGLRVEIGGGIRTMETIETYFTAGVYRVILGTAALRNPKFLAEAVERCGGSVAVGVDIRDGNVAVNGWTEVSDTDCDSFCTEMEQCGVRTVICTDISKDGAMQGTNRQLYARLQQKFSMEIIASGGISTLDDVRALSDLGISGAILGKALYTGAIDLKDALRVAGGGEQ